MTDELQTDRVLRQLFEAQRERDAASAPAFAAMRDAARRMAEAADNVSTHHIPVDARPGRIRPLRRALLWGAPLLVAAGLAIAILRPETAANQSADREFEALVSEWSRTAALTQRSPTDRLLSLPGSEFLRGTPSVGSSRIRRPS